MSSFGEYIMFLCIICIYKYLIYYIKTYTARCPWLTHWGRDKMAAIFQTTFSNVFSWIKMYELRLTFHLSLFLEVQLTRFQHWFRWWLGTYLATSHYLKQWWLLYWRLYASLGLNELRVIGNEKCISKQCIRNHMDMRWLIMMIRTFV